MTFTSPLHFVPNIRVEQAEAKTGYTWGKPAKNSNILQHLPPTERKAFSVEDDDIVAERWMVTDDRGFPSYVRPATKALSPKDLETGEGLIPFYQLLEQYAQELLGPDHVAAYGPHLNVIMKQLDTNAEPTKGSLSVQLHPKVGHPTRPAKPEMWKGTGQTYLGWNQDMTEAMIREAVSNSTLEQYMNAITMTPDKLILVSGGLIHAVRYNTFTAEWSKAPGKDDLAKGNVKDATVSPYDRTDGKTPRPGKEDIENSLEVMRHANTFSKKTEAELLTPKQVIDQDDQGNIQWQLFRTPEVSVDEYRIMTEMVVDLSRRGLPVYVEQGSMFVMKDGEVIDEVAAGEELFLPHVLGQVTLKRRGVEPVVLQTWYAPLQGE